MADDPKPAAQPERQLHIFQGENGFLVQAMKPDGFDDENKFWTFRTAESVGEFVVSHYNGTAS